MNKKVIHAISFLHNGERVVVKPTTFGKFRVPVVKVENGSLKTRMRALTAMEILKHDIIKNCDPTFYLENNERLRVYPGGDPSYLPAQSEGLALKHDTANKVEIPKLKNKINIKPSSKYNYEQASLDMYGWYPGFDDGTAD
tara:strand:- start:712 stop:1134 length:423 start_codon:yes stop_codon:yes gene_type:complete